MNNICNDDMSDAVVLEQFSELVNEICQIEVATDSYAARTVCNIGGIGGN